MAGQMKHLPGKPPAKRCQADHFRYQAKAARLNHTTFAPSNGAFPSYRTNGKRLFTLGIPNGTATRIKTESPRIKRV
jgi:lysylphosphatidylglycerol synthetase-like protein (DUF2156 family)